MAELATTGVPLTTTCGNGSITIHRDLGERPHKQSLEISFQRTVRVADNGNKNNLPPSLGHFPVHKISDYQKTLPHSMAGKGGYFFPMYQREAMWMNFTSSSPFAIKIYLGGVNAVSGEPARETETTMLNRLKLMQKKKCIQDYVVIPAQLWLDGVASTDGTVCQFVAMPLGKGYSVEAQITGEEAIGGIQIEVVPAKVTPDLLEKNPPRAPSTSHTSFKFNTVKLEQDSQYYIYVKTLTGKSILLRVSAFDTIYSVKGMILNKEGIPHDQQRLIHEGKEVEDDHQLWEYYIEAGNHLNLVLRLRGGGPPKGPEMGVAAGGIITQTIKRDRNSPNLWERDCGTIFNVQIMNSAFFQEITGKTPPPTPITAATYAKHGLPYFEMWDETASGVVGDFSGVKSVNEMDIQGKPSMEKAKAVAEVIQSTHNPIVVIDHEGRNTGFRTISEMENEVRRRFKDVAI